MLRFHKTPKLARRPLLTGFSLVEVLIAITIIGILGSIAINQLATDHKIYEAARNRRNAQEVASLCTMAYNAGVNFAVPNDPVQTTRNAVAGAAATNGSFAGQTFRLPGMQEEDILAASYYLDVQDSAVLYAPDRPNP